MKRLLLPLTVIALLPLSACASSSTATTDSNCETSWSFPTVKEGTLQVAGITGLPYLDIPAGSRTATGVDGDLLTEFARRACLDIEFQSLGGPAAVSALTSSKVDAAAGGWYATEERGKSIGQSDTVWQNFNSVVVSKDIASLAELKGTTVGVVAGSVYVQPLEELIGAENTKQYQTADAVLQDLKAGRLDAAMGTSGEMQAQVDNRGITDFHVQLLEVDPNYPELTAIGNVNLPHDKANTQLTSALNEYVAQIKEDGTLQQILADYGMTDPRFLPAD